MNVVWQRVLYIAVLEPFFSTLATTIAYTLPCSRSFLFQLWSRKLVSFASSAQPLVRTHEHSLVDLFFCPFLTLPYTIS